MYFKKPLVRGVFFAIPHEGGWGGRVSSHAAFPVAAQD